MSKNHHPEAMQQKLVHLFKTHEQELREDVVMHARLIDWITMHGYLQLALRHPDTTGVTRHFIEELCLSIEQAALAKGVWDWEMIEYLRRDQKETEAMARQRAANKKR